MIKRPLTILLASPRGFCAGVDRAIQIVERAIEKFGAPVYVRHEIVHNRFVVQNLVAKGAIFVDELNCVPKDRPVIFSAHGVPRSVPREAQNRQMIYLDATCPLVSKVHREVERHEKEGRTILLIGHANHPEVIGTMGQVPEGTVLLVETMDQVASLPDLSKTPLAYATQTTLSVDEAQSIIDALKQRFPHIEGPRKEDICYATTNRQLAVKEIAKRAEAIVIVGAPNSSNSLRLVEVAEKHGCPKAILCQRAKDLPLSWLEGVRVLGLSAGASAPEVLVQEIIDLCSQHFSVTVEEVNVVKENIVFHVPKMLAKNLT
jgi:4-hydroxy-3-methylbut-2-enyl diphosphate reductase